MPYDYTVAPYSDVPTIVSEYAGATLKYQTTGISEQIAPSATIATEYYTLDGRRLAEPQRGVNIRVERLANGKSIATKVVK